MSPKQRYWTNFSPIGIGILQQVLNSGESSFYPGSRAGRFVMLCVVQLDGAARSLRPRFTPCGASGRATLGVG